jgi:hypothetical protein
MDNLDRLVQDVLLSKVQASDLTDEELDLVFDRINDMAQSWLNTDRHDLAVAMLEALGCEIDDRVSATDMSCFEQSIVDAEARGSVYYEFDEYTIH